MTAQTKNLWAPIIKTAKGNEWIHWYAVASTRRESKRRFLERYVPEVRNTLLKDVRFARVTITEQGDQANGTS